MVTWTPRSLATLRTSAICLIAVAVDEHHPAALVAWVAALGFVERLADYVSGVEDDAGRDALVDRPRARPRDIAHRLEVVQDVHHRARKRRNRVNRGHFGHALAIALFSAGQARSELACRSCRRLQRRGTQILGSHDDAGSVETEHQQVVGILGLGRARGVKLVEVARGADRQLLHLPLVHWCARRVGDRRDDLAVRGARRLLGRDAPHAVRVQVVGQVQHRVHRVQAIDTARLVRDPRRAHRPEQRHQRTIARAPIAATHTVSSANHDGLLPRRPQIQVRLQQQPLELAPLAAHVLLQLAVLGLQRRRRSQVLLHRVCLLPRARKSVVLDRLRVVRCAHRGSFGLPVVLRKEASSAPKKP